MRVVVYDPTQRDTASAVRGVGRYVSLLKESFPDWEFRASLSSLSPQNTNVLINPFIDFLHQPFITKKYAKKQIGVIHDVIALKYPNHFPTGIKGKIALWRNRLALSQYDTVLTDSHTSKADIHSFFHLPEKAVKVVYPYVSHTLQERNNWEKNSVVSPFFLYVGDATWNKNIVNLAKAIVIAKLPCFFVGKVFERKNEFTTPKQNISIWEKELFSFFQVINDSELFVFPGYVSNQELQKLYQNTLCTLLVSRDEGFGFSYLESAFQQSPCLLSSIPIWKEIAKDAAFFCDENDPHDIAKQLVYIASHEKIRKEVGFKAQERSKLFSQENFIRGVLSVVDS